MRRCARNLRGMRRAVRRPGRRPGRHRRRRVGVSRIPVGAGRPDAVVRRLPAPGEPGAAGRPTAAMGELGDAGRRTHPPLRHVLLRRSVACRVSVPTARIPNPTVRDGRRRRLPSTTSRQAALFCCRRLGHSWTRWPDARSPTCWPSSVRSSPCNRIWRSTAITGFSSSSTPTATTRPAKPADRDGRCERVRQHPRGRTTARASEPWCSRGRPPTR